MKNEDKVKDALIKSKVLYFVGVKVYFPKNPFKTQIKLLNNLINAFKNGENAILESPTGTGKVRLK